MADNRHTIRGTIFAKDYQEVKGVKDPSATYAKNIITLEVSESREIPDKKGGTRYLKVTEYPQLESFGINMDEYSVGDLVEIRFHLSGRKWTSKATGKSGIMTKAMIDFIKFGYLDGGSRNTTTPSFKRDETFTPPDPDEQTDDDTLPF